MNCKIMQCAYTVPIAVFGEQISDSIWRTAISHHSFANAMRIEQSLKLESRVDVTYITCDSKNFVWFSSYLTLHTRGKSLLKSWATTFLPN